MTIDPNKTAFLFPGQGSQAVGMGKSLAATFPSAAAVFTEADRTLGLRLTHVGETGDDCPRRLGEAILHSGAPRRDHDVGRVRQQLESHRSPPRLFPHETTAGRPTWRNSTRLVPRRTEPEPAARSDEPEP